jgi:hypothetical protein
MICHRGSITTKPTKHDKGSDTVNATSSDGTIRLVLPAVNNALWTVTVSEQNIAGRSVSVNLKLIADTTPPHRVQPQPKVRLVRRSGSGLYNCIISCAGLADRMAGTARQRRGIPADSGAAA